jgi:hypothetical protein
MGVLRSLTALPLSANIQSTPDSSSRGREAGTLKRLFTTLFTTLLISLFAAVSITLTILCDARLSSAQVLQGSATLSGSALTGTGHSVTLTWIAAQNATSYNIYRGTASGGPYVQVASGIAVTSYVDTQVGQSQTLYYVATAVRAGNESKYSNEAAAVIP